MSSIQLGSLTIYPYGLTLALACAAALLWMSLSARKNAIPARAVSTFAVIALPLGVLVALARMSSFKPLALVARFFISVLRGTPLMLQLMAWMFFPYYVFGMSLTSDWKFYACAIGFILNYSAYFAEIYRSGIQSIPRGQYEAAQVLHPEEIVAIEFNGETFSLQ